MPSGPYANSCMLSLPRRMAPARASRATTVASSAGTESARILEPPVVRTPFVEYRSFGAQGTPWSGPRSEEHTSELQSLRHLVCRLLLEKKKKNKKIPEHTYIQNDHKHEQA